MKRYHRPRMDPDYRQAAPVALQELGEHPHEHRTYLFVEHHRLRGAYCQRGKGVVGTRQFGLQDQAQGLLHVGEQWLGKEGEGDTVRNGNRTSVQVCHNHVHLNGREKLHLQNLTIFYKNFKQPLKSLTSSATSDLKEECTPITKGVGVESTSTNGAGNSGM